MKLFGSILPFLFILTACSPIQPADSPWQPWRSSDIRYLGPPDTTDPTSDLIAIYSRINGDEFQFRFDILDLQSDFNFDIYIALDSNPSSKLSDFPGAPTGISSLFSNQGWDYLIGFPLKGNPYVMSSGSSRPEGSLIPVIQRDPLLDVITVSFNRNRLRTPNNLKFQVFITTTDGKLILDQSPQISNMQAHTIPSAPLILVFSDIFPAISPAQALRRWDGAHTGPTGERHGLLHILSNAEIYNLPVVLLDLKTPNTLSALDFIGAIPQIQKMVRRDLLILPDIAYAQPGNLSLLTSLRISSKFSLPASIFSYSTDGQLQTDYRFQFVNLLDQSHFYLQAGQVLIPLPDLSQNYAPTQATMGGLSLEVRRQLLTTALSPDPADIVVLGGSLPNSTWGDSDMSNVSMAYISAHPWIQPLNAHQIQAFKSQVTEIKYEPSIINLPLFSIFNSQGNPMDLNSNQLHSKILEDLQNAPKNTITDSAWQFFFTLTSPTSHSILTQTRYQYLNQVESMLAASHWMDSPAIQSDCSRDLDLDSINECVLSNTQLFAIIEPDGGRLSFLYIRSGQEVYQLIGPLSQFSAALGDPSQWHPEKGPGADHSEIPGAFSDSDFPFMMFQIVELKDGSLTLNLSDGQIIKVFRLIANHLTMDYETRSDASLSIPLAVAPQTRFQPGWSSRYFSTRSKDYFRWGVAGEIFAEIHSTATIRTFDFTESNLQNSVPEDPNRDYPPGHFLPFPLAIVEISGLGHFSVEIHALE